MLLKDSFENFLSSKVNLDQTRFDRIVSAHNSIRDRLEADGKIQERLVGFYLQGSYALRTVSRPHSDDVEYDVDVVGAFDFRDKHGRLITGPAALDWLYRHINSINLYEGKTEKRRSCVRIHYQSDGARFHVDVVPAHRPDTTEGPIRIPPDWDQSNPRGYKRWFQGRKDEHCKRVKHLVRLLKYWRNLQCEADWGPNSMVLTTLVGQHTPADGDYKSLDDALVQTMTSMDELFQGQWHTPEVLNPSLQGEDLARNWSQSDFKRFRRLFRRATETAQDAIESEDEEESIELWNTPELFDGKFPKTTRGLGQREKAVAAAMANGGLFTDPSGRLGSRSSKRGREMPDNHGYYGQGDS